MVTSNNSVINGSFDSWQRESIESIIKEKNMKPKCKIGDKVVCIIDTDLFYSSNLWNINLKNKIGKVIDIIHIEKMFYDKIQYMIEYRIDNDYISINSNGDDFILLTDLKFKKWIKG